MPVYYFKCPKCEAMARRLLQPEQVKDYHIDCPECDSSMKRFVKPPSTNTVERLDNGAMPRAVERPADAERLYHERAKGKPPV